MIHAKKTQRGLLLLCLLLSYIGFSQIIKSPVNSGMYGFVQEKVKSDSHFVLPCSGQDVVVYNVVSANDDGVNDFFYIKGIENCPNNTVSIYNRWGVLVYETYSYDTNGNVFKGFSEGNGVINSNSKLAGGTYFYIIILLDESSGNVEKKSGYLYLND